MSDTETVPIGDTTTPPRVYCKADACLCELVDGSMICPYCGKPAQEDDYSPSSVSVSSRASAAAKQARGVAPAMPATATSQRTEAPRQPTAPIEKIARQKLAEAPSKAETVAASDAAPATTITVQPAIKRRPIPAIAVSAAVVLGISVLYLAQTSRPQVSLQPPRTGQRVDEPASAGKQPTSSNGSSAGSVPSSPVSSARGNTPARTAVTATSEPPETVLPTAAPPAADPLPTPDRVLAPPAVNGPTRREREVAQRYARAIDAMKQRAYREAVPLLEDLERDSPGYRDVSEQLSLARDGVRTETQLALARDLEATRARQLELDQAAADAARREADRQAQLQVQREAATRFFLTIAGTWTHEDDRKSGESRTLTEEELTIGADGSGVLTRRVSTYTRGFAGWKPLNSNSTRFAIQCDGTGRVSGDLNSQVSRQGPMLVFGSTAFSRRR